MYIPRHFREEDREKIFSFIQEYNFGILMTSEHDHMKGTHLPFIVEMNKGELRLITHLASANDQLEHLIEGENCLVIFNGPHAYVSPALYAEKQNVPTWNFIAVHLYGRHRIISDYHEKKDILERSILSFDEGWIRQWNDLDINYRDRLIGGMTGLEVVVEKVEAKYKLSQNRSERSRQNVTEHFLAEDHEIGGFMKEGPIAENKGENMP